MIKKIIVIFGITLTVLFFQTITLASNHAQEDEVRITAEADDPDADIEDGALTDDDGADDGQDEPDSYDEESPEPADEGEEDVEEFESEPDET